MQELILYNGKIYTQDRNIPWSTAIAVQGNRIRAVGSDAKVLSLATPDTRQIDLRGQMALPGLTDSHFHYYDWALGRRQLNLAGATSLLELREQVVQAAQQVPAGHWILGQGWNETRWPDGRLPTRADLDGISPAHPVILWRSDMHLAVANSQALSRASITDDTPNPPQGIIDRDITGQPTGVLRELAINLVRDVIPPPTENETTDAIRAGFSFLHRLGLTGVHDYRIMGGAEGAPAFRAYQRLCETGEIGLRLWMHLPVEHLDQAIALGLRTGFGNDYLRVGHVKLFSDGSQGARTAWMLEPYKDVNGCGMPLTPMDEIAEIVSRADETGLAVAIHAIGDRANRELITLFEEQPGRKKASKTVRLAAPHRIDHVQNIRPDDVLRLGRLNVVASVQPIHVTDDIAMVEESVGKRGRWAYPFRDMLSAGVTLTFGSDCPVADPNPLWGIHAAVTRQRRDGTPAAGWYPDQRLTVAEALWGFTMAPALASGQANHLGSLTPGKLADLVVIERDIFSVDPMDIAQTRVVMTIFDGQIIYEV